MIQSGVNTRSMFVPPSVKRIVSVVHVGRNILNIQQILFNVATFKLISLISAKEFQRDTSVSGNSTFHIRGPPIKDLCQLNRTRKLFIALSMT